VFSKATIAVCAALLLAAVSRAFADDAAPPQGGGSAAPATNLTGPASEQGTGDEQPGNFAGFNGIASCDVCPGLVGGLEAAILRPRPGMTVADFAILGVNSVPYHENQNEVTPRIWLGYVNESGLGARIRYWTFDEGLAQDTGTFTGGGETLVGYGMLRANTIDFEATQEIQWGRWGMNVGGGLRYGSVVQLLSTQFIYPPAPENETLNETGSFFGVGPTLFAEFHRPIGDGGLALVANLRGSLLFGAETNALTDTNNLTVPPTTTPYLAKQDQAVGIAEIQMGLEWSKSLSQGRRVFVQALWEGQIWDGMQNSAYYYGAGQTNLGLDGFSFNIGLSR
jgi:hypothetical protein